MFDIWGFLLQTLTVSGVAVLLIVIKALFKDKLPPKWHFAVWGVLGVMILIPAGLGGRYTLFHWQLIVESVKSWVGDYSFTRVIFPVPILTGIPKTILQWLFTGYVTGIIIHVIIYFISYIRLRLILRKGVAPDNEQTSHIREIALSQRVKLGRVIAISGLPSAFVCGIFRPVLVVPADSSIDDKVILHELLHMKYKDTFWSAVICFLRCLHWCNPLIIYCANQALNDIETRCDQRVLEQLEGEERRDYGRILLSMANDRFTKTPGSTCINNGGKNIRRRIEAIARFKKYPVGMKLVSVCVIILLTFSLAVGVQASKMNDRLPLASARSVYCTTPAGAFDTYAKAVLEQNGYYRVMCAPEAVQKELIDEINKNEEAGTFPNWDCGLSEEPISQNGYYIYNLRKCGKNTYEGLLVMNVYNPLDVEPKEGKMYISLQNLKAEKENGRWTVTPLEKFRSIEATDQGLDWGCTELPGFVYSGTCSDFRIETKVQTVYKIESNVQNNNSYFSYFDTVPKPNAEFKRAVRVAEDTLTHIGTAKEREKIERLGLTACSVFAGEERPDDLSVPYGGGAAGSSNQGEAWASHDTEPGWGPSMSFGGGGSSFDPDKENALPEYFAADLYVNGERVAQLDLTLKEGTAE